MSVQKISLDSLPSEFNNVICENGDKNKNKIIVRSNLKNMDDINNWVISFEKKNKYTVECSFFLPTGKTNDLFVSTIIVPNYLLSTNRSNLCYTLIHRPA